MGSEKTWLMARQGQLATQGTAATSQPLHIQHGSNITAVTYTARQQHHNRYIYSHHEQLLLFLSISSILINF